MSSSTEAAPTGLSRSRWSGGRNLVVRRWVPVLGIAVAAFVLRLVWALHANPVPVSDFFDYWTLARDLADHRQFGYPEPTAFFLPMHPLLLAPFAAITDAFGFVRIATILVSSATVIPAAVVGRNVVGTERGAIIAAAGFAVFPTFVLFSPVLATEHLFIFLMVAAIALATSRTTSLSMIAATGIVLGLAQLTRGEAVFYTPAFVLWFVFRDRKLAVADRLKPVAVLAAAILVVLTPWWVRNAVVVDPSAGLSSSSGLNFYFAHNDSGNYGDFIDGNPLYGLPSAEASALGWELGLRHIREHPLSLVEDVWVGTTRLFGAPDYAVFWSTQVRVGDGANDFTQGYVFGARTLGKLANLATLLLLVLAAASLAFMRTWSRPFTLLIVPLIASTWILRTVIYWAKPRYGYFITAMLIFAAAITIDRVIVVVRRTRLDTPEETGAPSR
ncbi:MAG: glycosyltransferase family 39 protein [Acidimicrobiia bacterium]|nr:glycosyltransferase family 39 protein [Acidimicrobiia bacterium]